MCANMVMSLPQVKGYCNSQNYELVGYSNGQANFGWHMAQDSKSYNIAKLKCSLFR